AWQINPHWRALRCTTCFSSRLPAGKSRGGPLPKVNGRALSPLCTKSRRKKPPARRVLDGGCGPEISLPTLGRRCGVSSSRVLTMHTRCAALQKSKQRFGRPTAFKIVQGGEQNPPDDPEAQGPALSHSAEGRVPENVERAVIE